VEEQTPSVAEQSYAGKQARNGDGNGAVNGVPMLERTPGESTRILTREQTFRRLLGIADALAISAAVAFSVLVIGQAQLRPAVLAAVPLFVVLAKVLGLYDRDEHLLHKTTLDEVPVLFGLATMSALLLWLSDGLLVNGSTGRGAVVAMWLLLFLLMIVFRSMARNVARRTSPVERCLFVGGAASAEALREKLAASHSVKAELVGWLPFESADYGLSPEGGLALPERVRGVIAEREVERVILGPGLSHSEELLDSIRRIKDHGLKVSVLPDVFRVVNSSTEIDRLNGITLLGVRRFEITRSSRVIKRSFDLTGSLLGLALCAPLMAVVAIAIKLDSPGPVLFRQRRAGRDSAPFAMLKFRSMVEHAEEQKDGLRALNEGDGVFKISNDPRITRVGRVIRKLYLDELPQLVNVVRGEMSLVGPRPLPLDEDRRIEGWHRRRLDIAPGITGPWQVLGSSRIPVREMVHLDYQYVADWSLWNDIRILLLTVGRVISGRGI
jgi:exopolysaccharide biosynthesis polyprenyl glycosylphosphotransferase